MQTAPELEMTGTRASCDYIGQLLEMETLNSFGPGGGSEDHRLLHALRALSPAPGGQSMKEPQDKPCAVNHSQGISIAHANSPLPVGMHSSGAAGHVGSRELESSEAGDAAASGHGQPVAVAPEPIGSQQHQCVAWGSQPAQPQQPSNDEMDVAELLTFDESLMLLPLPADASPPRGNGTAHGRRPMRTESSPCSLADAFPSFSELTALPNDTFSTFSGCGSKESGRPSILDIEKQQAQARGPSGASQQPFGMSPWSLDLGLGGACVSLDPAGGDEAANARAPSPWKAPWYFGSDTATQADPQMAPAMDSAELEGYLAADRFLTDSPVPGSRPPSRPTSRGPSWPSPSKLHYCGTSTGFDTDVQGAQTAAAELFGGKSPARLPSLPELCAHAEDTELAAHADGQSPPHHAGRIGLLSTARSTSLPRIADLQLGSPLGSNGDLQPPLPSSSLTSSDGRLLPHNQPHKAAKFTTIETGPESQTGLSSIEVDSTGDQAGPKSPTAETRGKAKHLRQQHIFPHDAPSLPSSARRKWCKVSSDGNLSGREQLP